MSAYINAAADDANDVLSGFRASLSTVADAVEAVAVLSIAAFLTVCMNVLF